MRLIPLHRYVLVVQTNHVQDSHQILIRERNLGENSITMISQDNAKK